MRIAVDLMGSDSSPHILFQGVLSAANALSSGDSLLILSLDSSIKELKLQLSKWAKTGAQIDFQPVPEFIQMEDSPLHAIRTKKKSSLVQGVQLVKEKRVDAFVSAGNTGALIALSKIHLPLLAGIDRPALLAFLPSELTPIAVIDVGGNVTASAEHLVQHGLMGVAYQRCLGIKNPKVGLLNIGSESKKGRAEIQQAYKMLSELKSREFTFVGNIEGREAFQGKVDVLITDGFSGNIFLKTAEGVSSFIFDVLKSKDALFSRDLFPEIRKRFDYDEYPGAAVCGVDGVVIKCHGYSSPKAMCKAIYGAMTLCQNHLLSKIKHELTIT